MRKKLALLIVILFVLSGCAAWNALTPDEKARTVVDGIQDQVNGMYDTSKAYVVLHPEYEGEWKTRIVPAFNLANKTLKEVIALAEMELITPSEVRARVMPLVNSIVRYLGEIGFFYTGRE